MVISQKGSLAAPLETREHPLENHYIGQISFKNKILAYYSRMMNPDLTMGDNDRTSEHPNLLDISKTNIDGSLKSSKSITNLVHNINIPYQQNMGNGTPADPLLTDNSNSNYDEYVRERYQFYLAYRSFNFQGYLPDMIPILNPDNQHSWHHSDSELDRIMHNHDSTYCQTTERRRLFSFSAGTFPSSLFNLASATLGAGVLSLPYTLLNSGIIAGIALLILFSLLSRISCHLLINTIDFSNLKTYEELTVASLNKYFAILAQLSIIGFCFGTSVAYLVTLGDILELIVNSFFPVYDAPWQPILLSRSMLSAILVLLVLLPLSLAEKVGELRFTSLIGVSSILYLVFAMLIYFCTELFKEFEASFSSLLTPISSISIIRSSSVILFAFTCQPNLPAVFQELNDQKISTIKKVTTSSVVLCFVTYSIIGLSGLGVFRSNTDPNILTNLYPLITSNWYLMLSFFSISVGVIFAYPLNIFPCRFSLEMLVYLLTPSYITSTVRILITISIVSMTYLFAILLPHISIVFELIGSTTGVLVCFILPGFFYIRLTPGPLYKFQKIKALGLIALGSTFGVIGLTLGLQDAFRQIYQNVV